MISDKWVSVEYYLACVKSPAGPRRIRSKKHGPLAYYGGEAGSYGEPAGIWYTPGGGGGTLVRSGSTIQSFELRRLAAGRDIHTDRPLSEQIARTKDRRAASDVCMSPPKDFSIIYAAANRQGRRALESIIYKVCREVLDLAYKNGLFECRQGAGGEDRSPALELAVAMYLHHSSRDGDPQIHIHNLVMNAALRKDGTYGAINNEKFKEFRVFSDAVFKYKLGRELENIGVPVEYHEEHGFTIEGISPALREDFSERRMRIKLAAAKKGFETKDNAVAAQVIALETRGSKSDIPPLDLLDELWARTFADHGTDLSFAQLGGPAIKRDPATEPATMQEVIAEALAKITETASYMSEKELATEAILKSIGRVDSIANMDRAAKTLTHEDRGDNQLIEIGKIDGKPVFSTRRILDEEARIIEITKARMSEPSIFSQAALAAALSDDRLSTEQQDALTDALGSGGVIAIQGGAGTGKTMASIGIKRACQTDGKRLFLASPEWKPASTLATELDEVERFSVDRIINMAWSGKLKLTTDDVILVDESGKLSRDLAYKIMEIGELTGAKIILIGDTKQMSSVRAGDPFALITRANPSAQIRQIRRQRVGWQRDASMAAQAGEPNKALDFYYSNGQVSIDYMTDEAISRMAAAYLESDGKAVAIASSNLVVRNINEALRAQAREIGLLGEQEITIQSIPRGKNAKPTALAMADGDRIISGGQLTLRNGQVIENGTVMTVRLIGPQIELIADDGRIFETDAFDLSIAGHNGSPPRLQHAYCLTTMSSQGGTWDQVLWFASSESVRAALVGFTRHRDDLKIFLSRETAPNFADGKLELQGRRLVEVEPEDERTNDDIIKLTGKSLARIGEPRNASDLIIKPANHPSEPSQVALDTAS